MSATENTALTRRFYDARGDRAIIDEVMSQDVVWDITPGFPHGGVYRGLDTVLTEFLGSVREQFSSMAAKPDRFLAAGDHHVIVLGHYAATAANGRSADARFVHIWTIENGKLARLHQTADTHLLAHALQA